MTISTQLYVNNAKSVLATGISPSDTALIVTTGTGGLFPSPSAGQFFLVTLEASGVYEIIKVSSRTGDTLTVSARAQEGTTANTWPASTPVEVRLTAGAITKFLRAQDKLFDLASVDLLSTPAASDANTYICHNNDEAGNPVVAINNSLGLWRLSTHTKVHLTGAITSVSTTTSAISTAIAAAVTSLVTGKYVIQFTSGANSGLVRAITSTSTDTVGWATALSVAPSIADTFDIYVSDYSLINSTSTLADDSLVNAIIFGS